MVRRTSLREADCPVARSLDTIGDWWSLLIIRDAFDGMRRFGEFQKSLGVAKGILSARLNSLVNADVLALVPASNGSAYKEYVLTEKGRGLFHVIVGLRQWGEAHLFAPGEPHSELIDIAAGQPVGPLEFHSLDGRVLGWEGTVVRKVSAKT
ncbi:helix-turn-helix domain-containing protein [Rhizobium sp. BK376]|uniref:winged helix-turn-helix transcriptional regulator n=1 Tax=Rhizobium sp. BK376 TaxID=2512149 RepID=UPI001051593E|nr:helix-turn-helix domain-containing protein [Rhizobium sp. BK376]TCR91663.1 HxlR family transcriptional regulator [Rhizobium sp. BK376]